MFTNIRKSKIFMSYLFHQVVSDNQKIRYLMAEN